MNETVKHVEQQAATAGQESREIAWETPGYVVVETALEVTAYARAAR
ncbi:pyrroloquinoline quinone precursor peptide PqqA [Streptomyces sp. NPDC048191]